MWEDGRCYEVLDSYCDEMYAIRTKSGEKFVNVSPDERLEDNLVVACTTVDRRLSQYSYVVIS